MLQLHDAVVSAQVASRETVIIFDLHKLNRSLRLDDALATILQDERILKLGCGVGDDMKIAAKSYGHMKAFQQAKSIVDLRTLFAQQVHDTGLQVRSHLLPLLPAIQASFASMTRSVSTT